MAQLGVRPARSRWGGLGRRAAMAALAVGAVTASAGGVASATSTGARAAHAKRAGAPGSLKHLLPASIRRAGVIDVGGAEQNPPILYLNISGSKLTGVNYWLSNAMASLLGVKFKWISVQFSGLIPALQANRIEMIFSSMDDTAVREQVVTFVDYMQDGATFQVATGNPKHVNGLNDSLCGLTVSALQGSLQVGLLQSQSSACTSSGKPAITLLEYADVAEARLAVQVGKAEAFFGSLASDLLYQTRQPNVFSVAPGPVYGKVPLAIGVPKGDMQLAKAIRAAIVELIHNGTYANDLKRFDLQSAQFKPGQVVITGA